MTTAFVLGNGVGRAGLDLDQLRQRGKIYGCNALYREFVPDVLVATDRPIAAAIEQSGYALTHEFYTRRPLPDLGARRLPPEYTGYSSGPNAVALAAKHQNLLIYLLGFDMGPSATNQFNNVYADTEFYKSSKHPPTFTGNWARQLVQICQDYPATQFVRVHSTTTAAVPEFDRISNLASMSMAMFVDLINNTKDVE